jgi:SAM-dependent methyltransferase
LAEARPYYADRGLSTVYYDLVTAHDPTLAGDVDLYAGLAPQGGSILDLGAGTGRVSLALAERGFSVVGVDLAPGMLAQAEAKRAALAPDIAARVRFQRGDMTALALGQTFDAVICAFFGLAHLPAGQAKRNAFQVIARHLKPGGRAAVHLPLRRLLEGPGPADRTKPVMHLAAGPGRILQLYVRDRAFREKFGRFDQVIEYRLLDLKGAVLERTQERQTFYDADPLPDARAAGLEPDPAPIPLGDVGEVFLFRKP